jgi:hypothetical protein
MSRPDPIQYAERLYAAIRAANFSPLSFLAFGNAVKEGIDFRRMPRMAAEPFMRVVGEMLDLEDESQEPIIDAVTVAEDVKIVAAPALPADVVRSAYGDQPSGAKEPNGVDGEVTPTKRS